jgi:hypothetical protein
LVTSTWRAGYDPASIPPPPSDAAGPRRRTSPNPPAPLRHRRHSGHEAGRR